MPALKRVRRRLIAGLVMGLPGLGGAALLGLALSLVVPRDAVMSGAWAVKTSREAGLEVRSVRIQGLERAERSELRDYAEPWLEQPMVTLKLDAVRMAIANHPWVEQAQVARHWPDRLTIKVREHEPAAVLLTSRGQEQVITVHGEVLPVPPTGRDDVLPRVRGRHAPEAAPELGDVLRQRPRILSELIFAERIGGRRWDLHVGEGAVVRLPERAQAEALDWLLASGDWQRALKPETRSIDLRYPDRSIIRSRDDVRSLAAGGEDA
jgi:cell division protein FtsQ